MNNVILIGRLTADPDLKFLPSGIALTRFSLAVNREYKKNSETVTDFIPIEIWGKKAEYCATYIKKGTLVAIEGVLHVDRYLDKEGTKKNFAKVIAEKLMRLSVPASTATQESFPTQAADGEAVEVNNSTTEEKTASNFTVEDGDLPF